MHNTNRQDVPTLPELQQTFIRVVMSDGKGHEIGEFYVWDQEIKEDPRSVGMYMQELIMEDTAKGLAWEKHRHFLYGGVHKSVGKEERASEFKTGRIYKG